MLANIGKIKHTDATNAIDNISTSVWFNGCPFRCTGCHNATLFDKKAHVDLNEFIDSKYNTDLAILGGEPLSDDNIAATKYLISAHHEKYPSKRILLWSAYALSEIQSRLGADTFSKLYFVKTGTFKIDKRINGRFYGSSNQEAYVFTEHTTMKWNEENKQWESLT